METDEEKRKELYGGPGTRSGRNPLIFAHYETINYLMRKNVEGSTVNPTLGLRLENVSKSG